MLAAAWPCAAQIWRVNAATDVLPLVPVTAPITCGWRGKNFAAVSAKALSPAHARQNQLVGGRQLEARLEPEQGGDAADNGAPNRHRIPSRGGEAVRVGRRLRLIEHDEEKVARLIGRQDRGEGREH